MSGLGSVQAIALGGMRCVWGLAVKEVREVVRQRLILELEGVSPEVHTVAWVYDFVESLSREAGMRVLVPPIVVRVPVCCAADQIATQADCGISAQVIWLESGVQIHSWPEAGLLTLDVFSCKPFDEQAIIRLAMWLAGAEAVTAFRPQVFYSERRGGGNA